MNLSTYIYIIIYIRTKREREERERERKERERESIWRWRWRCLQGELNLYLLELATEAFGGLADQSEHARIMPGLLVLVRSPSLAAADVAAFHLRDDQNSIIHTYHHDKVEKVRQTYDSIIMVYL